LALQAYVSVPSLSVYRNPQALSLALRLMLIDIEKFMVTVPTQTVDESHLQMEFSHAISISYLVKTLWLFHTTV